MNETELIEIVVLQNIIASKKLLHEVSMFASCAPQIFPSF